MTEQPFERQQTSVLQSIREGMDVDDSAGNKIGTVEYVHFGTETGMTNTASDPARVDRDGESFIESIAEVFAPEDRVPDAVRSRLMNSGFIRIDTGVFSADRYVTPDQIDSVVRDRVRLRVRRGDVIKA